MGALPSPPQPFRPPQIRSRTIFLHFLYAYPALGAHWQYQPRTAPFLSPQHPGEGRGPPPQLSFPWSPKGPPAAAPWLSPGKLSWEALFFLAKMFLKHSSFGWFGFGGMQWDPPRVTEETLRETAAL